MSHNKNPNRRCPFSIKEDFKPNSDSISCPMLNTLYNQNILIPDEEGYVTIRGDSPGTFESALNWVGFDHVMKQALYLIADQADVNNTGKFNLFTLPLYFDHIGSTGIRDNTLTVDGVAQGDLVKPELVDKLKSFGDQTEKKIWARDFGKAARSQEQTDLHTVHLGDLNSVKKITGQESAVLLSVFGRRDPGNNQPYLTFGDIDRLWINAEFPKDWTPDKHREHRGGTDIRLSLHDKSVNSILPYVHEISCPKINLWKSERTQRSTCEGDDHLQDGCKLNTDGFINKCEYDP